MIPTVLPPPAKSESLTPAVMTKGCTLVLHQRVLERITDSDLLAYSAAKAIDAAGHRCRLHSARFRLHSADQSWRLWRGASTGEYNDRESSYPCPSSTKPATTAKSAAAIKPAATTKPATAIYSTATRPCSTAATFGLGCTLPTNRSDTKRASPCKHSTFTSRLPLNKCTNYRCSWIGSRHSSYLPAELMDLFRASLSPSAERWGGPPTATQEYKLADLGCMLPCSADVERPAERSATDGD